MAYVLTSLSGNLISAASAGFAPTNSADVSAIASAYAESAASSKQDTLTFAYDNDKISAINGSALAGQGGGGLVTAIGTSNSGITSLNNSGLVDTAALRSADYSSLYVQEPLYISASGDSSYIGISGDVGGIDSATCSAIASAYAESAASSKLDTTAQVVTATATQLYAGSAYLTSVNGTPISAARAGNAANASLATSAWYDGSGRFISALPDSATVSSIAAAYAESAASSKQDTLSFAYNTADQISSINGSALAGGGGAPIVVTGTAWDSSTSAYVYPTSNLSAAERHVWTWQNGNKSDYIEYLKDDSGNRIPMMAHFLAAGAEQMYYGSFDQNGRIQFSPSMSMFSADGSNKYGLSPLTYATGASMNLSAGYFRASYRGDTIFISRGPTGTIDSSNSAQIKAVRIEAHNGRGSNISAYDATTTGYYGSTGMKLGRSGVFVDDSGNSSNTAASATLTTGSLTFYSAGSSDVMSQSSIPYWNGKADSSALSSYALSADVSGTVDLVSTQSANWGGSALALSAGPGVKLEKSGNILVAGLDGAMINEETIAGIWNGKLVYQMLLSGTGQTPGISNIALPASLTGTSIESKWLDPSDSYILYGTVSNRLPMSWCLGDGRYGALNIVGSNVTMRSTDTGTNNCSAYFKVKYIKAEA